MQKSLDKLAGISNIQEDTMTGSNMNKKGYFQGAEEDEPTPGQPKYTKDPLNEQLRETGDKHMHADDTGPVDGLHPGPASVGMSELERKKMLARAQAEENTIRRNAIVAQAKQALEQKKNAYFQGGGGANEPTPHKVKYPADKLNEDVREDGDKQMVGQKPFPGVGSVDGLHPSPASADVADEKKRKELLNRASLKARFVKASNENGTQDLGKSAWEVFQGDKLLLTASVNDLSGGRSEMLYDSIATKEFGARLIDKIKVQGADKIRSLVKSAQMPQETAPVAPEATPAPEAVAEPMVEPAAVAPEDTGKAGDPKDTAVELAEKITELSSDLVEAIRVLTGEQAEMGAENDAMVAAASSETKTLHSLRKEINGNLIQAMKEAVANFNDHKEELDMVVGMYEKGSVNEANKELVSSVVEEALTEAKTAVANGFNLMTAFVKYARGTKAIVKRAQIEAELNELAKEGDDMNVETGSTGSSCEADDSCTSEEMSAEDNSDEMTDESLEGDADAELEKLLNSDVLSQDTLPSDDTSEENTEETSEDADDSDDNELKISDVKPGDKIPEGLPAKTLIETAQGRAQLRAKLAADALKTSPHLHEAHPKGSFTTELDVKPTGNLAAVETLEDQHEAMLDIANAPPKVRKEAEEIHRLVREGKLDPADLNALVAEGLDKDAVSYYKKYFSQVDGGSEFASELVKEHVKAELEDEMKNYRVKLARAFELAYDMVERGLCHNDRNSVSSQVDEIMTFNDSSFDSLKRVVAKHEPVMNKTASRMPQVGMTDASSYQSVESESLVDQLSAILSKSPKKMF